MRAAVVEGGSAARAGKGAGGEKGTGAAQGSAEGSVAAEGGRGDGYRSKNDEIREKARRPLLVKIQALNEELMLSRAETRSLSLSLATVSTASSQAGSNGSCDAEFSSAPIRHRWPTPSATTTTLRGSRRV